MTLDQIKQEYQGKIFNYLILDNHNRWHSTGWNSTFDELEQEIFYVKASLEDTEGVELRIFVSEVMDDFCVEL